MTKGTESTCSSRRSFSSHYWPLLMQRSTTKASKSFRFSYHREIAVVDQMTILFFPEYPPNWEEGAHVPIPLRPPHPDDRIWSRHILRHNRYSIKVSIQKKMFQLSIGIKQNLPNDLQAQWLRAYWLLLRQRSFSRKLELLRRTPWNLKLVHKKTTQDNPTHPLDTKKSNFINTLSI